jgi:hypothetical protein
MMKKLLFGKIYYNTRMTVINESVDILIIAQIMRNILDDFSYEFGYINNEDVL